MAKVTQNDVTKLEAQAAKAKAAYAVKAAKVRRAHQRQQADHARAMLRLLQSLGLLAYDVETLRVPLTILARELQASETAQNAPGTGVTA